MERYLCVGTYNNKSQHVCQRALKSTGLRASEETDRATWRRNICSHTGDPTRWEESGGGGEKNVRAACFLTFVLTLVEVHVSVDVRQRSEVLVAVGAAVDCTTVWEHGGLTHLLPSQWRHHNIQSATHHNNTNRGLRRSEMTMGDRLIHPNVF